MRKKGKSRFTMYLTKFIDKEIESLVYSHWLYRFLEGKKN